jgi:hypothetical protein
VGCKIVQVGVARVALGFLFVFSFLSLFCSCSFFPLFYALFFLYLRFFFCQLFGFFFLAAGALYI